MIEHVLSPALDVRHHTHMPWAGSAYPSEQSQHALKRSIAVCREAHFSSLHLSDMQSAELAYTASLKLPHVTLVFRQ
jgi:hypothetical protein